MPIRDFPWDFSFLLSLKLVEKSHFLSVHRPVKHELEAAPSYVRPYNVNKQKDKLIFM